MKSIHVEYLQSEEEISSPVNMAVEKAQLTKFTWSLPNRFIPNSQESASFALNGIDECICKLSVDPQNPVNSLAIEFSDTILIQTIRIIISLNQLQVFERKYSQPVPRIVHISDIVKPKEKVEKNDFFSMISPINRSDISQCITASFAITKFSESESPVVRRSRSNVLATMKTMFYTKKFSDVTFDFGDKEILGHRAVLAAQSEVFEAMFQSEMKEKETSRVKIVDIQFEIFEKFLDYLYTGRISYLPHTVEEMLPVADKYQVNDLKNLCENYLLRNLRRETVGKYLLIADTHFCTALKKKALEVLQNSGSALIQVIINENLETLVRLKKILTNDSLEKQ